MMQMPQDIVDRIRQDYGPSAAFVADWLSSQMQDGPENVRVIRCALFAARGNLDELGRLLDHARVDYRDVIFWVEYTNHSAKTPERLFDFSQPFGEHLIRSQPREEG